MIKLLKKLTIKYVTLFVKFLRTDKIKLNIGSGGINIGRNWISSDINTLNILNKKDWYKNLLFFKASNILAEHVWEHFDEINIFIANSNCYKFLKKGGKLRLAVPDGFFPNEKYIDYVKPGGYGCGSDDHKILFNYKTLKKYLEDVGFQVIVIEYWDENGVFHAADWDVEEGFISRSAKYDRRNKDGSLVYTSLIVDAIK